MKTIKLIPLLFLLGMNSLVMAQLTVLRDTGTGSPIMTNPYQEVKGSQYIEDFRTGNLLLPNGQTVEGLSIALNGYDNTLEYKMSGSLFAYSADKLAGFAYINDKGEMAEYTSEFVLPTLSQKRFIRVLEKGEYSLYSHDYKIMTNDVGATYGAQASKVFQTLQDIFVAKDGEIYLFKNKKKDLEKIFGEDYEKVAALEKSLNLNLKETNDIRLLIRALNQGT
ncbi:hypothetical protein [Algoriphagus confluentis]|uniref:WG repeat-containing protein n=1 Tax=Algoriphagus confluentis TaxID=1697556 RepID=A0ABQ6PQ23_9BACT|nr:hypothetical protein Aconfl_19830 [Algoriphagus confluentis]